MNTTNNDHNPDVNNTKNHNLNDTVSYKMNTTLSLLLETSDFSLLSLSDLVTIGKTTPTDESLTVGENDKTNGIVLPPLGVDSGRPLVPQTELFQLINAELPQIGNFFQFGECIGVGGYCFIHKAYDTVLYRNVAIKTLRDEHIDKYSKRHAFITEAKLTAILDHPNIIPIHGLYTDEKNRLHLVIKLIEGKNLMELLQKQIHMYQTMPHKDIVKEERNRLVARLDIFLKICDAVSYAHDKKVLHRDLKPGNIMVGPFNEVYVMDWGIAESREDKMQRKKNVIQGTPQFLAPELVMNHSYDSRSDIYSLGAILFSLVYFKKPFPENIETEELFKMKLQSQTLSMKHAFDVKIPKALEYIIQKAMAVQPAARYQTVQALADDLHRFMRGEQVVESIFGQLRNFINALFHA